MRQLLIALGSALLGLLIAVATGSSRGASAAPRTDPCAEVDAEAARHRQWLVSFFGSGAYADVRTFHNLQAAPSDSVIQATDSTTCFAALAAVSAAHKIPADPGPAYVFRAGPQHALIFPEPASLGIVWFLDDSLQFMVVLQR